MYTPYFIRSTPTKKITLEIQRILSCLISHFLSLFTQARDARIIVGLFSEEKAVEVFCQVNVGEWDFRFCGFGYFSDRFFRSLCQKTAVFRFCRVVTVVCGFSVLKHLVFGICKKKKKKNGFTNLVSDVIFGFSYLGSSCSSIWAAIIPLILNSRETSLCSTPLEFWITGMWNLSL